MKRSQWLTVFSGIALIVILYLFGRTISPGNRKGLVTTDAVATGLPTDSILAQAKRQLNFGQLTRLEQLEHSISRGDVHDQQIKVFHQLAHFWYDSVRIFEPYAWYESEAARLENSEKSLTFAAHQFLQNLRGESNPSLKAWKALQAKDLFERSLKINPKNDSSLVGLGACYIFGNISETPMEGILKIKQVVEKDSSNVFAQMMLAHGSMISGQYDKAILRFQTIVRLQPDNLEAVFMIAEAYERKNDKQSAISWYEKSLPLIKVAELKEEVENRIKELKKL